MPPRRRRDPDTGKLVLVTPPVAKDRPVSQAYTSGRTVGAPRPRSTGKPIRREIVGKMADLIRGELSIDDMDNEELARMQFRDVNGRFSGRPPANLPREIINSIRAELHKRLYQQMDASLEVATQTLIDIASDETAPPAARIKASNLLIERRLGKVPDKVEVSSGDKPFEVHMSGIVRRARERGETHGDS